MANGGGCSSLLFMAEICVVLDGMEMVDWEGMEMVGGDGDGGGWKGMMGDGGGWRGWKGMEGDGRGWRDGRGW